MAAEVYRIEIPVEVDDKTNPGIASAERKMNAFDKSLDSTKKKLDEFNRTKFSVVIDAVDKASAVAERIGTTVKGIAGKAWKITMSVLDKATAPIRGIINLLKNPLIQLGAVVGVTVSVTDAINTFKDFEATMSKVQAVGEMTADQISVITAKAKEMGATTKFTATEAGEAFTYMAQAGWSTQEMLDGIQGVLSLSAADGLDLASTASIVTDTLAAFGLQASDTAHFADVLAKAAAATNVDVAQMGETFTYVAPIAGAMGYSIEDMSTAIGLMANASVKGSMAGTALKTAISNMVTPTDEQAELMKELGVSMTDSEGKANNFMTVMTDLRKGFSKLSETEKTAAASTLFGSYAMSGMLAIMNASEDSFNSLSESIANAEGTAQQMSEVMLDNLAGSFTLLQSAADGVKISLGQRLSPYLRQFATWLTGKMPAIQTAVGEVMDFVDEKVEWLKGTINEFTSGEDWENADIWGKIKIAWDKIVAEPFSQWWNSTGKAWFAEKAASIGQGIGSGLTTGLLALLGVDVSDTLGEGKSVGASFLQGFKQGFDTEAISNALKEWAENNKEIVAALGVILGGKLIGGVYKGVKEAKSLVTDIKNIFSKGSNNTLPSTGSALPSAYTTTTMTVTASVVNVYGATVNNAGEIAETAAKVVGRFLTSAAGGAAGAAAITGGTAAAQALITGGTTTAGLLTGGAAAGAGAAAAGGTTIWAPVAGVAGEAVSIGTTTSAATAGLANTGIALGSTASTVGGAAAAGAAGSAGIIGGILGLGSAVIDLFQGIGKSKEGDSKGAKDEYVTSGTKAGMVGAGAGIGAAVGSVVPGIGTAIGALVGAGVGGVGALLGGDAAGKAISDGSDEGGWLDSAWKGVKGFFTDTLGDFFTKTVPKAWNSLWGSVGNFFTSTVPTWWGNLTSSVSTFFTETIPEKWEEFWDGVGSFFTETIPYALGYATAKVQIFFTETIPGFFGDLWEGISTFFGSTLPTWASGIWNDHIVPFFTEDIPEFFGGLWDSISTFFTSTLPTWASGVWNDHIVPFFTEDIPEFFSNLWDSISTFFTSTLPTWASTTWNDNIVPFFTEDIPDFFGTLWDGISTFFTTTLPNWASSLWNDSIVPFFTETIPGFFSSIWEAVTKFFTEAIPTLASNIWSSISGWFRSIGDWFGDVWGSVKSFFGAGYSAGMQGHASGGIMTSPHIGLVAEAGAEAIIPLSPSRRTRGIDLWRETGQLLGVRAYADGGIVGDAEEPVEGGIPVAVSSGGGNGVNIKIEVTANPEFRIEGDGGADETEILAILKAYIRSMTDDIGDELAEKLSHIFKNMPVTA
ncbi:MAG: phage tail tape measure protein [Oscillospiraceae bacterium]|nr:phage tail tape measure protein [Oscillospiraceae bacterium]